MEGPSFNQALTQVCSKLKAGTVFKDFEEFMTLFQEYKMLTRSIFVSRHAVRVDTVNRHLKKSPKYRDDLVYKSIQYQCKYFGIGPDNVPIKGAGCGAKLRLFANKEKDGLVITAVSLLHTKHPAVNTARRLNVMKYGLPEPVKIERPTHMPLLNPCYTTIISYVSSDDDDTESECEDGWRKNDGLVTGTLPRMAAKVPTKYDSQTGGNCVVQRTPMTLESNAEDPVMEISDDDNSGTEASDIDQEVAEEKVKDEFVVFAVDIANDLRRIKTPGRLIQAKASIRRVVEDVLMSEIVS